MSAPNGTPGTAAPQSAGPLAQTNAGPSNAVSRPKDTATSPPAQNGQSFPPAGDTNAAAFIAEIASRKSKPNPLPISSLRTGFCYDIRMRFHQTVDYRDTHPEDPRRIYRIYKELALAGLIEDRETQSVNNNELMMRLRARYATEDEILVVHSKEHLAEMQATEKMTENQLLVLGRDEQRSLYFNNESYQCALLSCGGAIETCAAVMDRVVKNAIAVIRPPGHHAEPHQAMGFCLFNNVAVATKIMQQRYGEDCQRVMILDWDVHHGNGTQSAFQSDPNVLYISLHRFGIYPEDKAAKSRRYCGEGEGLGKNVNIPWAVSGVGDADYIYAFQKVVMPIAYEFNPQLVIVSAGFDAAAGDPIGGCEVTPAGYAHMTHMLMPLAEGKLVLALEGGYNLESTAKSALACVRVLMGEPPGPLDPWRLYASEPTVRVVNKVINTQSKYWKCFRPETSTIDGSSPTPERLNGIPHETTNIEIIRAYQTKKAQERWGMTPLPIAKNDMTNFEDQVFCTPDFYDKKTLILFIHDAPDVIIGPNAVVSSKMDLNETFLLDASNKYFEWAKEMDFGLIDVNIPPSSGEMEEDEEGNVSQHHIIQNAKTLCLYIWDNYVELTDADNVILMGAGEGCYGIEHLVKSREETVKGVINFFGDFEPKSIGDTDEDKVYWYMKSSRVYIGPRNPILRRKKIPKRFGQCLQTRISPRNINKEYGEMNKLLNVHFEEITAWLTPRIPVDAEKMDTS